MLSKMYDIGLEALDINVLCKDYKVKFSNVSYEN